MNEIKIPKSIGTYIFRESLGSGAFSSVYLAIETRTKMQVAIKVIEKQRIDAEKLKREVDMLKKLDHPFIVSFFELLEDEYFYYLVMENVEGRTIFKLVNVKGPIKEWLCRHIFCQLISALEYLHVEKKVVHRDLKAENIMIDKFGNIRLIDFGLSNVFIDKNHLLRTACGSPAYAAPEMFKGQEYNSTADLWSAGVVLYTLAVGKLPFEDKNLKNLINKILTSEPEYPETLNPQLVDLLHRMMMKDISCRMSIQKIREHPWFSQYHYASMMDANFGLSMGLRIHDDSDGDIIVLSTLESLGLDGKKMLEDARRDIFNSEVTPLRIVHRTVISMKLKGMYGTAEKCDGFVRSPEKSLSYAKKNADGPLLSGGNLIFSNFNSFKLRRDATVPVRRSLCGSMVNKSSIPKMSHQATSLAISRDAECAQSLKNQHYRALTTMMNINGGHEHKRRQRCYSFTPETPFAN